MRGHSGVYDGRGCRCITVAEWMAEKKGGG